MIPERILLAVVVDGRWRLGIGDPSVLGWVTVAAYVVSALGCFLAASRELRPAGSRPAHFSSFWLVLASLMIALGINKQLDLQSLITQIGREMVLAQNLYSERRELQAVFILAVALFCAGSLALFLWAARRNLRGRWPALIGIVFILGFVVIRAASFHHVDAFLASRLGGLKWNGVLEIGGTCAVALAAFRIAFARST
jgi:hypothetical protein